MQIAIENIKSQKHYIVAALLIVIATLSSFQNLAFYLKFDYGFMISLLLMPFVLYIKHKRVFSVRYALASIVFLVAYPLLKVQFCYFFAYAFFVLFIIENTIGRLNNLPFFLVVLLSPMAFFVFQVFGFPIRLELTKMAVDILQVVFTDIRSSGNIIILDGEQFRVDPECMGLKMVSTSFIIALAIIAFHEKKSKSGLSFLGNSLILMVTSLFILLCNLMRIIGIILFRAAPETPLHEIIGLISILFYVVVPVYFLSKLIIRFLGRYNLHRRPNRRMWLSYPLFVVLLFLLLFFNINRDEYRNTGMKSGAVCFSQPGYKATLLKSGVSKLQSKNALVYIKPSGNFYASDHTPLICWKGSGYKFRKEQIIEVDNQQVFFAELKSSNSTDTLYTCWWYQNDAVKTISQLEWRWRMAKGEEPFRLINITCGSRDVLIKEAERFLGGKKYIQSQRDAM